jgi:hypothetical protein
VSATLASIDPIPAHLHDRDQRQFRAGNRHGRIVRFMDRDPLEDMPEDSRAEIVGEVRAVLDVDHTTAEDIVRSSEPFWDAMERAGGLVDSWGGGEFCHVLPRVLVFIRDGA